MKTKALVLLLALFVTQLISSCCKHVQYSDFDSMTYTLSHTVLEADDELLIELFAEDIEYLGSRFNDFGFSSALAYNCDEGYSGMKDPINQIEITSNADFNEDFAANDDLSALFRIKHFLDDGEFEYKSILSTNLEEMRLERIDLLLSERPALDDAHSFTITLTKTNGDEIVVNLEEVTWQ